MKKLLRYLLIVLIAILVFTTITACEEDEGEPGISNIDWDNHEKRSEQFVEALLNGDYTIATAGFNEEMKQALGANDLRRAWIDTTRRAGNFIRIVGTEQIPDGDYDIYHVVTQHEKININSRIVFTPDGQVTGLFFSYVEDES